MKNKFIQNQILLDIWPDISKSRKIKIVLSYMLKLIKGKFCTQKRLESSYA